MSNQSFSSSIQIKRKVVDTSDKNLFFKFAVRHLILFVVMSILIVFAGIKVSNLYYTENLHRVLNETALSIAEIQSSDKSLIQKNNLSNQVLSLAHEELLNNETIKDAALIVYNLESKQAVASSGPIAVYDDEELVAWCAEQSGDNAVCPTILPDSLIEFYDTHRNVVIKTMSYLNGSLVPEEVTVKTSDKILWNELKRADENRAIYGKDVSLKIIGNRSTNPSLATLSSYAIRIIDKETKEVAVFYDDMQENLEIETLNFTINGIQYRLDVAYNHGFIFLASNYLLIFEFVGLILCFGFAYFRLREHKKRYY